MTHAKDASTFDTLRPVIASDPYHQQFQPLLDYIDTLCAERDALRKDVAKMRELLAIAFREGWNCGDWQEGRDNVSAREYDWNHSAVKAMADAARTADAEVQP